MEVEIISRECIKPSSPTPFHLKTYKFCLFDQFLDHFYAHRFLYYPLNQEINLFDSTTDIDLIISKRLQILKHSLLEALAHFYPLAGTLKDSLVIDCNDQGVYFVEARADKTTLNEFLSQPDLFLISKFIPVSDNEQNGQIAGAHVAKIQVTSFVCGGLVICASISHSFGDATTYSSFLKSWAAAAGRNNTEEAVLSPNYDASFLFPQNDACPKVATWKAICTPFLKTGRFVTRRVVFDAKALANLKAKATSSYVQNPTRVEVVSALLSKCIMTAFKTKPGSHTPTLLTHAVNLRRKVIPPLPESSAGNIVWIAHALCTDEKVELDGLVFHLREAITKINKDFVKRLQGDGGYFHLCEAIKDFREAQFVADDKITFSSWCNLGCYDVDFGWGKPIWVSFVGLDGSIIEGTNTIILIDTRRRDGIEAWLVLLEEDMALLQLDKELLAFATFDPSPLGQGLPISHPVS